jgi:hypothetical protein
MILIDTMSILMIRMSDTQLPETDHTPYCPGRDIGSRFGSGFIIERSKELQVASRVKARGKGRKGSRDHAGGSRERSKGKKGSCDHADGSHARSHASGKGRTGNGPGDRAHGGALAHAHTRACTRACARTRTRGARQYEVLRLQHLQKPLAA